MRLHRYFGSHADTTLREKRLLLAKVSDFNDPFEFTHLFSGDYNLEQAEKDVAMLPESEVQKFVVMLRECEEGVGTKFFPTEAPRRRIARFFVQSGERPPADPLVSQRLANAHFRLCCFSMPVVDPRAEILLWSHYARSHKGARIEFELDEGSLPLFRVEYSHQRCAIDLERFGDPAHTNEILQKSFTTKADAWAYEHEIRLIVNKACIQKVPVPLDYRYYLPFDVAAVKAVDFGINCDEQTIEGISTILRLDYPQVTVRKAFHHPEDYAIEYRMM